MGDGADLALEQADIYDGLRLNLDHPVDLYEAGFVDELGYEYRYIKPTKTCRCCGTQGLIWMINNDKWLLHTEDGELHNCPVNPYNTRVAQW